MREHYLPFGIVHAETWSLPIAARKQPFAMSRDGVSEVMEQWLANRERLRRFSAERHELKAKFRKYHDWATDYIAGMEKDLAARAEWGSERDAAVEGTHGVGGWAGVRVGGEPGGVSELQLEHQERTEWALKLKAEVDTLRARIEDLERRRWVRVGRRLGAMGE